LAGFLASRTREALENPIRAAEADGTFFIDVGHHCAVGTKP
jgi:hypothetical protein